MKEFLLQKLESLFKSEVFSINSVYNKFKKEFNHIHEYQTLLNDIRLKFISRINNNDCDIDKFANEKYLFTSIKNQIIDYCRLRSKSKFTSFDPNEIWKLDIITEAEK
ncbi:MAG: hypothetical protein IPO92_21820 [Saprospiraceae bacterium]|nr:hypothetical protein [Saprospiraceae bacterium]